MESTKNNIDPTIGMVIDGKYKIDSLLGQGGMGTVYRVTHLKLDKPFALKLMNLGSEEKSERRLMRFRREAEALAKINHPNVVMVTDFGVAFDDIPYIVMEYIEGITLRKLLKSEGKLPEQKALHIARQICAALAETHARGIIHRDLKPANIIIQEIDGEEIMARVLDFGIAKMINKNQLNLTGSAGFSPGTLRYMAPEQLRGQELDARVDIYTICLILYEMLAGVVPHTAVARPDPLAKLRPDISPQLCEVVHKGLSVLPEDRYEKVADLKRALKDLEAGSASGTMTAPLRLPSAKGKSRLPMVLAASLIAVIAVVGVLAFIFYPKLSAQLAGADENKEQSAAGVQMPELVPIFGDRIRMGDSPDTEVIIKPFRVSKSLVTNRKYLEFIKKTGYRVPSHWPKGQLSPELEDRPVTNVSWHDANLFCNWLSGQTNKKVRLLEEAEWEYLARNSERYELMAIKEDYAEWTATQFSLSAQPNVKVKSPVGTQGTCIVRGKSLDDKYASQDPVTLRMRQQPDFSCNNLSFRIATDP